jgi:hypothetical protein
MRAVWSSDTITSRFPFVANAPDVAFPVRQLSSASRRPVADAQSRAESGEMVRMRVPSGEKTANATGLPLCPKLNSLLPLGTSLRRDNQDENRATIRMRMRRRGDYEGRA